MTLVQFIETYGALVGLGIFIFIEKLWPFFVKRFWPQKVKEQEHQYETDKELRMRQFDIEDRQVKAIEGINEAIQAMSTAITINNERLSNLIAGHAEHAAATQQAMAEMRVKIAKEN